MPINGTAFRDIVEAQGPALVCHKVRQMVGLETPVEGYGIGRQYINNDTGIAYVGKTKTVEANAFSIKDIAESIFGTRSDDELKRALGQPCPSVHVQNVLEGGLSLVPDSFLNISAFNATVSGLLEAKSLEAYNRADFLYPQLVTMMAQKTVQHKLIGLQMIAKGAIERRPGNRHSRSTFGERYVTTNPTYNRSNAIDVTREAVLYDLTGDVLSQADTIGGTMGLEKEYAILDMVLGNTNTYVYRGTAYHTYAASTPWQNKISSNAFVDWTNLNVSKKKFKRLLDQETSQPISIVPRQVLAFPGNWENINFWLNSGNGQQRTGSAIPGSGGSASTSFAQQVGNGSVPSNSGLTLLPVSIYGDKRLTDSDGGNLAAADADQIWYVGDFKKAFAWTYNQPLTTIQVTGSDYESADRGLVLSIFLDEIGSPTVVEPRYTQINYGTNAPTNI